MIIEILLFSQGSSNNLMQANAYNIIIEKRVPAVALLRNSYGACYAPSTRLAWLRVNEHAQPYVKINKAHYAISLGIR